MDDGGAYWWWDRIKDLETENEILKEDNFFLKEKVKDLTNDLRQAREEIGKYRYGKETQ